MNEFLAMPEGWEVSPPRVGEAGSWGDDAERVSIATEAELSEVIRYAEVSGRSLIPAGRGTRAYLGLPPPAGALIASIERQDSVVRHEPGDFTIGVQAGLLVEELREVLGRHGQEIPVDWARADRGTVGGLVGGGLPGPRRAERGGIANSLIGVRGFRGAGRPFRSGGMVVKNVAGYDLGRVHVGALGTLGVLLELNFRTRPLPERRAGGRAAFGALGEAWAFARALRREDLDPCVLVVLDGGGGERLRRRVELGEAPPAEVIWFFEGNATRVEWQRCEAERWLLENRPVDVAPLADEEGEGVFDALARSLEPEDPASRPAVLLSVAVVPERAERAGREIVEAARTAASLRCSRITDALGGLIALEWEGAAAELEAPLATLGEVVGGLGGAARLVFLPALARRRHRYWYPEPSHAALARRISRAFDPEGIFWSERLAGPETAPRRGA